MSDHYIELPRAVLVANVAALHVAVVALKTMYYGTVSLIPLKQSSKSVSKCWASLCATIEAKLITATEYHPQANSQVGRVIKTLVLPAFY